MINHIVGTEPSIASLGIDMGTKNTLTLIMNKPISRCRARMTSKRSRRKGVHGFEVPCGDPSPRKNRRGNGWEEGFRRRAPSGGMHNKSPGTNAWVVQVMVFEYHLQASGFWIGGKG